MKADTSSTLPQSAWDEAFLRVESYLHAHQIESRLLLTSLTTSIIEEAREGAKDQPDAHPVELSMNVVHQRMSGWFKEAFGEGNWNEQQFRARGRLSLVMTDMASSWAQQFLSSDRVQPDLAQRLNEAALQSGPELRLSKMPPAPIEFGFSDSDEGSPAVSRWAPIPAIAIWIVVAGAMGAAWAATH